jgi:hypothetical protein
MKIEDPSLQPSSLIIHPDFFIVSDPLQVPLGNHKTEVGRVASHVLQKQTSFLWFILSWLFFNVHFRDDKYALHVYIQYTVSREQCKVKLRLAIEFYLI